MGAIRCIAAEEELVVALFEWLKLNADAVPEHGDFIKRYKNHRVKLAFYPVLSQFRFVLGDMLKHGFTFTGLEEDALQMKAEPVIVDDKVMLRISTRPGSATIDVNPLHVARLGTMNNWRLFIASWIVIRTSWQFWSAMIGRLRLLALRLRF